MFVNSVVNNLKELAALLAQLSPSQYSDPCPELSNASIGEHTRHIIEMFGCLTYSYGSGVVDYDNRERNKKMQTDPKYASDSIQSIMEILAKPNKALSLKQSIDNSPVELETNYFRELLYNLEHCIHHQALIKVALRRYKDISVSVNFGVAPSTIEYRMQCAQ